MQEKTSPLQHISFEAHPFPYLCIDNFLSKDECDILIEDATLTNSEDTVFMHGGRFSLGSVSPAFKGLVAESESWSQLVATLKSNLTANLFLDYIREECPETYYAKWFRARKFEICDIPSLSAVLPQFIINKLNSAADRKVRFCTKKQLVFSAFMALFNDIYRVVHSFINYILGNLRLALLFDYSMSNKGYAREVHRDSDARVIVFLLYLNDLEEDVEGGSLKIHSSKSEQKIFVPRPDNDSVFEVNEFKPKAGRLVMFLNTANSYHSVEKMGYSKRGRHFLYGAYTLCSDFGALAKKNSSGKMPTEYNLYRE